MLFSAGGLFALYEGVEKIRHPHHLDSPIVAVRRAARRDRPRVRSRCAPRCKESRAPQGRRQLGRLHPARQEPGAAGRPARGRRRAHRAGPRAARRRADRADRPAGLGRHRHLRHRRAADRRRGRAGDRDQEPAARRVGGAGARWRDRGRRWSAPASSGSSTCGRCTSGPDELLVGAKLAMPAGATLPQVAARDRRRRGAGAGRRAVRPGHLPRARPRTDGAP